MPVSISTSTSMSMSVCLCISMSVYVYISLSLFPSLSLFLLSLFFLSLCPIQVPFLSKSLRAINNLMHWLHGARQAVSPREPHDTDK